MRKVQPKFDIEEDPLKILYDGDPRGRYSSMNVFPSLIFFPEPETYDQNGLTREQWLRMRYIFLEEFRKAVIDWTLEAVNKSLGKEIQVVLTNLEKRMLRYYSRVMQWRWDVMTEFNLKKLEDIPKLSLQMKRKVREFLRRKYPYSLQRETAIKEVLRVPKKSKERNYYQEDYR